jgi:hypothetical protein
MRVVFLDLDGVLNDEAARAASKTSALNGAPPRPPLQRSRVERLQRVLDATQARVVLVTGWRTLLPAETINAELRNAGLQWPIAGAVGVVGNDGRMAATRAFLDANPAIRAWVVLDDDRYQWTLPTASGREHPEWLEGRIVHPIDGLTSEDARGAVAIIAAQMRPR